MKISLKQLANDFSHELLLYAIMLFMQKKKLCHSLIDQECLQEKIDQWETADKSVKIFFRPKISIEQDGD